MSAVESALRVVLALPTEQVREVTIKLAESLASAPPQWPAYLHPAWKEELKRRLAEDRADDVSAEQVDVEMDEMFDAINRERDSRVER